MIWNQISVSTLLSLGHNCILPLILSTAAFVQEAVWPVAQKYFFFLEIYFYLSRLCWVLAVACGLLVAACVQDLVPRPGIEPWTPALGARSLTRWTTREVPRPEVFWPRSICSLALNRASPTAPGGGWALALEAAEDGLSSLSWSGPSWAGWVWFPWGMWGQSRPTCKEAMGISLYHRLSTVPGV